MDPEIARLRARIKELEVQKDQSTLNAACAAGIGMILLAAPGFGLAGVIGTIAAATGMANLCRKAAEAKDRWKERIQRTRDLQVCPYCGDQPCSCTPESQAAYVAAERRLSCPSGK